jgi:hypothetical protein
LSRLSKWLSAFFVPYEAFGGQRMSVSKHEKKMAPLLLLVAVLLVVIRTNAGIMPMFTENITEYAWQNCKAVHHLTQGLKGRVSLSIQ